MRFGSGVCSDAVCHLLLPFRQLKDVVESLVSYQYERSQAEDRLSELQKQTSGLPCVFPWPGLGERRQAVEQAQTLVDRSTALAPVLSDLRTQVKSCRRSRCQTHRRVNLTLIEIK